MKLTTKSPTKHIINIAISIAMIIAKIDKTKANKIEKAVKAKGI